MSKVAKLITISLTTRVIVDKNATNEQILEVAKPHFIRNVQTDCTMENIETIENDEEMPYGSTPEEEIEVNINNIVNQVILHEIDSTRTISVTNEQKNRLVDEDLIHHDSKQWLYFGSNESNIIKAIYE